MKDINQPIRKAFYEALNGNLSYNGVNVPVSDEALKSTDENKSYYVLLSTQSSRDASTKTSDDREATIVLDIVTKTQRVTKSICDNIAEQILDHIYTAPHVHTLTAPANWQFLLLRLSDDRHLTLSVPDSVSVVRRLLTFSLRVVQN